MLQGALGNTPKGLETPQGVAPDRWQEAGKATAQFGTSAFAPVFLEFSFKLPPGSRGNHGTALLSGAAPWD